METRKTALICHGGGMKSAFAAGVIYALGKDLGVNYFDIAIGASSSAPTLAYYLAGQLEELKDCWEKEAINMLGRTRYAFLKGEPLFNLDYMAGEMMKKKFPLNVAKVENSPIDFYIPYYNYKTDKLEYYHNHAQEQKLDIWQALRATMTIHDQFLSQGQGESCYVDPALADPMVYQKAVDSGATHFMVISNSPTFDWTIRGWMGLKMFKIFQAKNFPELMKDRLNQYSRLRKQSVEDFVKFKNGKQLLLVQPPASAKIKFLAKDAAEIKRAMDWGKKTILKHKNSPVMAWFSERFES
ncbi:MAG: hypothetical protein Q8P32_01440 [Candidatus Komeilibacteria bacterium]|nr:hypothetical protein [Candidatus Komeilibacteria bacterium]